MAEFTPETLLLASLPHGLVVGNHQRRITFINPAAMELLALDADRWLGQPLEAFCKHYEILALESLREERQAIYTNGQRIYVQTLVLPPEASRAGLAVAIMLSPQDVAHRAMTHFIGTISHEIRTPLTVIYGLSELLIRGLVGPLEADQQEMLASIRQHTNYINRLINNSIIIAELDAGTGYTYFEQIDLRYPIEYAIGSLRHEIEARGLALTLELPEDLPSAWADYNQVRIVLNQLLSNAYRYTHAGGIIVRASAGVESVRVDVEDSGCGIAPDLLPHIFERFVCSDPVINGLLPPERGAGLGLAICKQMIERQHGTISVASTPGQGSCVSITLPTTAPCAAS
ncbi:MAG: HAMP domain-containing histidine kinase [Oscillochloris sp.]|nr:HAMP domain-containing histidine kinase [Oscillochloris sp.]